MEKSSTKILVLKMGGQCNLHCKHCHCTRLDFKFNEDIIDYIKNNNFTRIVFSGGEPLLYWDIIKKVINIFKDSVSYKMVTNATLLTSEMVELFNKYNVHIGISYDGDNHSRDFTVIPKISLVKKLNNKTLVTLFSNDNSDIEKLETDLYRKKERYNIDVNKSQWLNFVHQTDYNNNSDTNKELAKKYCKVIANTLELDFIKWKIQNIDINYCSVLCMSFNKWIRKSTDRGVKCFRESVLPMTIEGKFMLCPYGEQYVGDIYTGIDWNKVESYIPDKCKNCHQWESCMNTCIANITDNECYISKVMYKHFYKLMNKYNVTYDELAEFIGR